MTQHRQSRSPFISAGTRAFWAFTKDAFATSFRYNLRLMAAPWRALWARSLDPMKSALRRADEDSDKVIARYRESRGQYG